MGHRGLPKVIQVRKIYMQKSDFLSFALNNCPVPTTVILMAEKSKSFGVGDIGLGSVPENVKWTIQRRIQWAIQRTATGSRWDRT